MPNRRVPLEAYMWKSLYGDGNKFIYGDEPKFGKLKTWYTGTNIKSIHNKVDEFELRVVEHKPNLMFITESWDKVRKPEREVNLSGYSRLSKPKNVRRFVDIYKRWVGFWGMP